MLYQLFQYLNIGKIHSKYRHKLPTVDSVTLNLCFCSDWTWTINRSWNIIGTRTPLKPFEVVQNKDSKIDADAIFRNFIAIYGPMKTILNYRGSEFQNEIIEKFNDLLGIEHNFPTPYHHRTLGAVEHSTMKSKLRDGDFHFLTRYLSEDMKYSQSQIDMLKRKGRFFLIPLLITTGNMMWLIFHHNQNLSCWIVMAKVKQLAMQIICLLKLFINY